MTVMPWLSLFSSFPLTAQIGRFATPGPFRILLRTTGYTLRPPQPVPFRPATRHRQEALLALRAAGPHQRAALLQEARPGPVPTIVLGGFVPDATEAVFLLRRTLLRAGSLYCLTYSRRGFSTDLICAQLSDLVDELNLLHGRPPVIFAISFGAGLLMEWLRRMRRAGYQPGLRGLVLVSPVACIEDLLPAGATKPGMLLGRALRPYIETGATVDPQLVEKSRTLFQKMFEAGAQNNEALGTILSRRELAHLRSTVLGTIRGIDFQGACERVQSLRELAGSLRGCRPAGRPAHAHSLCRKRKRRARRTFPHALRTRKHAADLVSAGRVPADHQPPRQPRPACFTHFSLFRVPAAHRGILSPGKIM
jgi:hypothetical protein